MVTKKYYVAGARNAWDTVPVGLFNSYEEAATAFPCLNASKFVREATTQEIKEFEQQNKKQPKMTIKDVSSNEILRNEYIEVVMSNSQSKPCEIISQQPIENTYVNLDIHNNWTYDHQIYTLAKFIPKTKNNNISLRLVKKNKSRRN